MEKETVITPTTELHHLGFVTNSRVMRYYITPEKWSGVAILLRRVLASPATPVSVFDVAAVLGKLQSLRRSHRPITSVMSRSLQHQLGSHIAEHGWSGSFKFSAATDRELTFFLDHLSSFHGRPIPSPRGLLSRVRALSC
jgi:hypothetical protein